MIKQNKETWAIRFKRAAAEIMPHMDQLQDLDDSIDRPDDIDEVMFRKGEYIGGMAAVILAIVSQQS